MEGKNGWRYFNRELSWLEFNERVLEEAQDKTNPLMERLKFLAITASNLDEFYMVRVSGLWEIIGSKQQDPSGLTPKQQLGRISGRTREMINKQYSCLNRSLIPALEKEGIRFLEYKDLNGDQLEFAARYFNSTVYPILTPMAIDQNRPFPLLNNKSLHIVTTLRKPSEEEDFFAVMQIPTVIPRIIELSGEEGIRCFMFLEDLVNENIGGCFPGFTVADTAYFRLIRNSDLIIDEEDAGDIRDEMERSIKRRKWGDPVRLSIGKGMSKASRRFLQTALDLDDEEIFEISGPLDLTVWMGFSALEGCDRLRNNPLPPQPSVDFMGRGDIFEVIRENDILIHHPYESFESVIDFVNASANDPDVLAIKQTLYRVSGDSPVVKALMQAAENGKQVTVLVELKARFDEENNINWAKKLENSGCHVIYGLVGLKIHCKICLVVRREEDGIRRYIHLGTGNYNDNTAKIYTDLGFFTCRETFGQDISALFNVLTGYSAISSWNKISVAPLSMRAMFVNCIENEERNAKEGKEARIHAKMNSLVDVDIINALYRASAAGVEIKLLVRGICCLCPGIPGVSENITVLSIIDRFLEHSRIFYFENGGNPKIYLSSADWMPRNLDRRVEVTFPVEDERLMRELASVLELSFSDTVKLRILRRDGGYVRVDRRGKPNFRSQHEFYDRAVKRVKEAGELLNSKSPLGAIF